MHDRCVTPKALIRPMPSNAKVAPVLPAVEAHGVAVVVLEALDPFAMRGQAGPFTQGVLDISDAAPVAVGGHNVADAAAEHMDVSVDEARQYGLAAHTKDFCVGPNEVRDIVVGAHGQEFAVADGNGLGPEARGVDGDDVGVAYDGVGVEGGTGVS